MQSEPPPVAVPPTASGRRQLSPAEVLLVAKALHASGPDHLPQAEAAYRHVLRHLPDDIAALTGLGLLRAAQGDPAEAQRLLTRVCALDPASAEAHNNLGGILLASQQPQAACLCFDAAIRSAPHIAEAYHNRAQALTRLDRHDEAMADYHAALALKPDLKETQYHLGQTLLLRGESEAAAAQFEQVLAQAPDFAQAHVSLGRLRAAAGAHEQAARHFRTAMEGGISSAELSNDLGASLVILDQGEAALVQFKHACEMQPDFAIAHNNLGNVLVAQTRYAEAVTSYHAAIAADPSLAEAHGNLGTALLELYHAQDAMPHFERALALNPQLAEVHNARGRALAILGDLDAANGSYARAVALAPGRAEFYSGIAAGRHLTPQDPDFIALENLARDINVLDRNDQVALHFVLHKTYEGQSRYAEAFAQLVQGNALRRASIDYDEAKAHRLIDRIASVFGRDMLRNAPARNVAPDLPIFILGMPRSGSTLIEQILSNHRDVHGGGELLLMADAATGFGRGGLAHLPYPDNVIARSAAEFAAMGEVYRGRLRALAPDAARITDKMPANFHHVGLIRLMLPNARIIHTRRNPLDTCLSCFAQNFTKGQPFTNDLGELGRYYKAYAKLMAHWREVLPEPFMLEVDYEELVADFEPQLRRILAYCGLAWDPACLSFHENPRAVITASLLQVRQPLYQHAANRAGHYGAMLQSLRAALEDSEC